MPESKKRPSKKTPQRRAQHPAQKILGHERNLAMAVSESNLDAAIAILARGADPRKSLPPFIDPPLIIACRKKDFRMAKVLLGAGAEPESPAFNGDTPLSIAADLGQLEIAVALCAAGADPLSARPRDAMSPMDIARALHDAPMLDLLTVALSRKQKPAHFSEPDALQIG